MPDPKALWGSLTPAQQKALYSLATAIVALLIAFGVVPSSGNSPAITETTVTGPSGPTTITAKTADVEAAGAVDNHDGANNAAPDTLTPEQVIAARQEADLIAKGDPLPQLAPDAAPSQPGCQSRFVKSYGSRYGTKPVWIVNHYTVSYNLPGFRDLYALTSYSANRQNGVSWTYNVDREGNCVYTVRETDAPWTQAAANRLSIGVEIINRGAGDGPLFTSAGLKKYARILSDVAYRWNIPIQRGKANKSTCGVIRKGLIDHNDLGACGGGHSDVLPYDVDNIIAAVKTYRATTGRKISYPRVDNFGPKRRAWCDRLAVIRKNAKADEWTPRRVDKANEYKRLIGKGSTTKCKFA